MTSPPQEKVAAFSTPPAKSSWKAAISGNVLMMGLVSMFTDLSSEMMNPLLPVFITGLVPLGWAPFYLGIMEGLAETTASLLKIFSGRLSDRLGKRKALAVVGYGLSTIFRPAMAIATAGWHVVAMKFADRVGKGIRTSPRDALIGDAVGADYRGLAFGFHRAMDHLGAVMGPLLAIGFLAFLLGWEGVRTTPMWQDLAEGVSISPEVMRSLRWLFALAVVPGVLAMSTLIGKVQEYAPTHQAGKPVDESFFKPRGLPKKFFQYLGVVTLFAMGNSSDLFIVYYGMERFGFGLVELVGLWVLLHISKLIFSVPGGAVSDRLGRRPVLVVAWLVYSAVYLGMAIVDQEWQFWALIILYGVYFGMSEGTEKALVADFVPSALRGTAFGMYHFAVGLAAFPAHLMFGIFWKVIGPKAAFGIGSALAISAAVLLSMLLATARGKQLQSV